MKSPSLAKDFLDDALIISETGDWSTQKAALGSSQSIASLVHGMFECFTDADASYLREIRIIKDMALNIPLYGSADFLNALRVLNERLKGFEYWLRSHISAENSERPMPSIPWHCESEDEAEDSEA